MLTCDPAGAICDLLRCAARLRISVLIARAQERSWDTCFIRMPTAARWLEANLPDLEQQTGHPVRSQYKLPRQPDVLPDPGVAQRSAATSGQQAILHPLGLREPPKFLDFTLPSPP